MGGGKQMRPEAIVLVLFMTVGLVVTLAILFSRNRSQQLLHEERMAALEKGVAVPPVAPRRPWSPRVYLLRGLIWSFVGGAVIVCLLGLAAVPHRGESAANMAFEARRLSDEAGVSREEAKRLVEKDYAEGRNGMPASVAFLGLLPLSVGLAYLVFYYTGESRKPAVAMAEADRV
jgi:hypothetical protein